jgi:hypothetical protein
MASARSPAKGEAGAQRGSDIVDRARALLVAPDRAHRRIDQPALGIGQPVLLARHLADDRFEHGEAFDLVVLAVLVARQRLAVDHVEGIEREARGELELDEGTAEGLDHVFERAAVVDHDDLGPCPRHRGADVLQEHRLARTRLAEHRDVVVARRVLERRPEERLPAPADEQDVRDMPAGVLALKRRDRGGGRRQHGLEALHALEVRRQPIGSDSGIAASSPITWR